MMLLKYTGISIATIFVCTRRSQTNFQIAGILIGVFFEA